MSHEYTLHQIIQRCIDTGEQQTKDHGRLYCGLQESGIDCRYHANKFAYIEGQERHYCKQPEIQYRRTKNGHD